MSFAPAAQRARRKHSARWLRDLLRAELLGDAFPDQQLPSEAKLMLTFGASRACVREALDLLRREGLVERLPGTGTLVIAHRFALRLIEAHGIVDYGAEGATFAAEVLDTSVVPMTGVVAEHLQEPVGTPCLRVEYVGLHRGRPIGVYTNYLRYPEAAAVAAAPFDSHWYTLMHRAGLEVGETDLLIEVTLADEALAELLGCPCGAPVLAMQQVIRDGRGRPYDFALLRSRGDRVALFSRAARVTVSTDEEIQG